MENLIIPPHIIEALIFGDDTLMGREKYSCDFETTTKLDDCRVWAYGYMEIGNKENYKIGNSLDEFMKWVENVEADLYFHNLRFDGEFIVHWLLTHGFEYSKKPLPNTFNTVISKMGQWYKIDICYGYRGNGKKKKMIHTQIFDSLKKLPFPVRTIATAFNLDVLKGDIDYHTERPIGHEITSEEYSYIKNDIEIVADALEIQFKQGLTSMTSGSDSLRGYKAVISTKMFEKLFPVFSLEDNEEIRWSYRGGFTWLNEKYAEKEIGEGMVFDVNSLYPSQMYDKPLPYGSPIRYKGEYISDEKYPLYIQHIRCEFSIKPNRIPTIQIKDKPLLFKKNDYLKNSKGEIVDLYVTNVDLELIKEHYNLYDLEYVGGWKFKQQTGMFKDFIDKWMYIKATSTGAIRVLAKLMLNSLYGKFATNPNVTGKYPILRPDNSVKLVVGDEEFREPIYTPLGVFITSWARYVTITTAQKCYDRIIYCDTDSIHITGTEIPEAIEHLIDDNKLGYWQHEATFTKAKFLRQKTYIEEVNGKLEVRCAGMPENIKEKVTFDNFNIGFKADGKLMPKHVDGGVVLVDTEFTIK